MKKNDKNSKQFADYSKRFLTMQISVLAWMEPIGVPYCHWRYKYKSRATTRMCDVIAGK